MDSGGILKVYLGVKFAKNYKQFPEKDKQKIMMFIKHITTYGFNGLPGRNKLSDDVQRNDPNWLEKVQYAQLYNLWHYHIGIPDYEDETCPNGQQTSKYVIHYMKGGGFIRIVDMSEHPPFQLPEPEYLN